MEKDWNSIETILKEIMDMEPNFRFGANTPEDLVEILKENGFIHVALHNRYAPMTFVLYYKDLIQMHYLNRKLTEANIELASSNTVKLPKLEVNNG
jgi:hypothetical protein